MLSRIFKGKNQLSHSEPDARRQAVEDLSATKAQALQVELLALASSDSDQGVRRACIARLSDLDGLAGLLDDPNSAKIAAQRVIDLIGSDSGSKLARHPLVMKLRLLAMTAAEAQPLLADISDTQLLIDLAIRARGELRDVILKRLQSTTALTQLEHQTRIRDKSLNRFARDGLERIRTTRHEAQQTRVRLAELADAVERSQRLDVDPSAEQRRDGLLREFEQESARFDSLAEQLRLVDEYLGPIDNERKQVAAVGRQMAETRERESATLAAAIEGPFPALAGSFRALQTSMEQGADFVGISAQRRTLTDNWQSATDRTQPSSADRETFEAFSRAYQQLSDSVTRSSSVAATNPVLEPIPDVFPGEPQQLQSLWKKVIDHRRALKQRERIVGSIAWPQWAKPNAAYADLLLGINRIEQDLTRTDEYQQRLTSQLEESITALSAEIDEGALKAALVTMSRARQLSKSLPQNHVANLVKKLNREAGRLAELRDWQTFATTPKREALCDAMQVLVDHPIDPPDQADRIKRLRAEWNGLGPVSRSQDHKLADQFNALAEQAFEPCRVFFGKQAELRKTNLSARRRICDQLENYLRNTDWDSADKKAAEQIMRAARTEWRGFHPVDRNPGRPLEVRFEKLQAHLHELLKAEWDSNLALKRAIVDEATAMLESSADTTEQVNAVKGLQRRWREIGITPRRPDQVLWREFRAACDAIFAARDESKQKSDQSASDAIHAANSLISDWEAVVASSGIADAEASVQRGFKNRFADLPPLPERIHHGLQRRFDELNKSYRALLLSKSRDAERDKLDQLGIWDQAVSESEAACRATANSDDFSLPDPLFDPRLKTIENEVPHESLRILTIRAELLAGMESPPDDRELRLQIQVDLLKAGMGQRHALPEPLALAREWCVAGPKHERCSDLRQRFFAALGRAMED